jgi:beta-glucosidase
VVTNDWVVESGPFQILVGKSSRDICLMTNIYVQSSYIPKINYTRDTFIGDFLIHPKAKTLVESLLKYAAQSVATDEESREKLIGYFKNIPISKLLIINKGTFTAEMLDELLKLVNE